MDPVSSLGGRLHFAESGQNCEMVHPSFVHMQDFAITTNI